MIQHAQVVPVDAAVAEEEFCVEAMCSFAQCLQYSMSDATPRLLLGALTREDKAGKVTMVVERMFRVKDEGQVDNLAAERSLVVELQANSAQTTATKRPANELLRKFGRRPSNSSSFESFLTPFKTRPGRRALCESRALTSC